MQPGFRMSIAADPDEFARVRTTFAGFADSHGVPVAIRRTMLVVLDELLSNIVSHGLAGVAGGTATIDVQLHPDRLAITLTDDGGPFDPRGATAPDTTLSVEERPIGGLGVHLVLKMVDEVRYERRDGHNVVVLVKCLTDRTT